MSDYKEKFDHFIGRVIKENSNGIFESEPVLINLDPKLIDYSNLEHQAEVVVRTNLVCKDCGESESLCVSKEKYIFCPSCHRLTDSYTQSFSELKPMQAICQSHSYEVISYTRYIDAVLNKLKDAGEPPFGIPKGRYFVV